MSIWALKRVCILWKVGAANKETSKQTKKGTKIEFYYLFDNHLAKIE